MLEIGQIVNGRVSGFTSFGAFVNLPGCKGGMVHISEISNTYVKDIKTYLTIGQAVKVKVIGISENGKVSLSIKQAMTQEEQERDLKAHQPKPPRPKNVNVWQGPPEREDPSTLSFEDMMARFKKVSDEKITDLKRSGEAKHGGYSRRGRGN